MTVPQRTRIDPAWRPSMDPVLFRQDFPLLPMRGTYLAFVAYHIEKADLSANWDATFYGWCDYRQREAMKAGVTRPTDSMGLPLEGLSNKTTGEGRSGAAFLDLVHKHQSEGKTFDEARLLAEAEMTEGETNG